MKNIEIRLKNSRKFYIIKKTESKKQVLCRNLSTFLKKYFIIDLMEGKNETN